MKRLARFVQLCFIQKSVSRALWVDAYENGEQGNGK